MAIYKLQDGTTNPLVSSEEVRKAYDDARHPPQSSEQVLFAEQIMSTPLVTIAKTKSLAQAREKFEQHRYRHLPVVNSSGRLVGTISERDLLRACLNEDAATTSVADVMNPEVLLADETEEIGELALMMLSHDAEMLPLLSSEGQLSGIVTGSDILRALIRSAPISSLA